MWFGILLLQAAGVVAAGATFGAFGVSGALLLLGLAHVAFGWAQPSAQPKSPVSQAVVLAMLARAIGEKLKAQPSAPPATPTPARPSSSTKGH